MNLVFEPDPTTLEQDLPIHNPRLANEYISTRRQWWGACRSAYVYTLRQALYGPGTIGANLSQQAIAIAVLEARLDALRSADIKLRGAQ